MTNNEFMHWIAGYLTLSDDESLDHNQIKIIRNHANLVKAVTGNLNAFITLFLSQIEQAIIINNGFLNIKEVKNIADRCCDSGTGFCRNFWGSLLKSAPNGVVS